MSRVLPLMLIFFSLVSCNKTETPPNKFSDPVVVKIADLKDRRSSDSLYTYFSNENSLYRKEAVLAFASIQDSINIDKIGALLIDQDTSVRKAAALALGQINAVTSISMLEQAALKEKDKDVLYEILEAYGKVAKRWKQIPGVENNAKAALAWSLFRAGLKNATDESLNTLAAQLLEKNEDEFTRIGVAHFFARGAKNFESVSIPIINAATSDPSVEVRMAATAALRKIKTDSAFHALEKILKNEQDYRVRINAVKALQAFPFRQSKDLLLRALNDKNPNVGIAASEVIESTVTEDFWIDLANIVTDLKHWRIQANLYKGILRVKENKSIVDEVKGLYQRSSDPYQKAALITALQDSPGSVDFIEKALLNDETFVIKSSAAAALVGLNRSKKFQTSLKKQFADVYSKAVRSGDPAVVGTIADALADSTLGYRSIIKDYTFLHEAKQKLALPKDNETLQSLESAIAHFENRKTSPVKNDFNHPIDWALVKSIPKDQRALIKTSRGTITIRLLVEEAPGSVANFVNLARQNYFDKKFFHRVVPNFVVQAGCNRGDGWGSEDYSIRSEFSQRKYKTGCVGMASAGKDTEGTQWFITHSRTPHLDGRYTIFAEVQSGMEVVHRIEVGDQILDVEIETETLQK